MGDVILVSIAFMGGPKAGLTMLALVLDERDFGHLDTAAKAVSRYISENVELPKKSASSS